MNLVFSDGSSTNYYLHEGFGSKVSLFGNEWLDRKICLEIGKNCTQNYICFSMSLEQKIRFHHLSQALTKIPHWRYRGNWQRRPPLLTQISCMYVSTFADLPGPKYTYTPTYRDRQNYRDRFFFEIKADTCLKWTVYLVTYCHFSRKSLTIVTCVGRTPAKVDKNTCP